MKVRCVRLTDAKGEPQSSSKWLTVGQAYPVLSVVQDIHKRWLFRLATENGPALFQIEQFEIISNTIPRSWVTTWRSNTFELAPEPWTRPGFWESFYDKDTEAIRVFEKEMKTLLDCDDEGQPERHV